MAVGIPFVEFTPEDVAANRQGQVLPSQRLALEAAIATSLTRYRLRFLVGLAFGLVGGGLAAVTWGHHRSGGKLGFQIGMMGVAIGISLVIQGAFVLVQMRHRARSLEGGVVERFEGPVQKRGFGMGARASYRIMVGAYEMYVSPTDVGRFPEGATVRMYVLNPGGTFLSFERL